MFNVFIKVWKQQDFSKLIWSKTVWKLFLMKYSKDRSKNMVILLDVKKIIALYIKWISNKIWAASFQPPQPVCLLVCLPACQSLPFRLFDQTYINFTILSFDGLDTSTHPANAASHITETQNLMLLCSLSYVICC
jgi:hypothetical protein